MSFTLPGGWLSASRRRYANFGSGYDNTVTATSMMLVLWVLLSTPSSVRALVVVLVDDAGRALALRQPNSLAPRFRDQSSKSTRQPRHRGPRRGPCRGQDDVWTDRMTAITHSLQYSISRSRVLGDRYVFSHRPSVERSFRGGAHLF